MDLPVQVHTILILMGVVLKERKEYELKLRQDKFSFFDRLYYVVCLWLFIGVREEREREREILTDMSRPG